MILNLFVLSDVSDLLEQLGIETSIRNTCEWNAKKYRSDLSIKSVHCQALTDSVRPVCVGSSALCFWGLPVV